MDAVPSVTGPVVVLIPGIFIQCRGMGVDVPGVLDDMTHTTDKHVLLPDAGHPITITPTQGRVVVTLGEHTVADTTNALTLQEAGYPAVQYLPLDDVDPALLERSDHTTYCPYKGDAGYYSLTVDGETYADAVWSYERPYDAVAEIAGRVAFYPNVVDVRTYPSS
jgi:uncharacterized protein (DUF427 family)